MSNNAVQTTQIYNKKKEINILTNSTEVLVQNGQQNAFIVKQKYKLWNPTV